MNAPKVGQWVEPGNTQERKRQNSFYNFLREYGITKEEWECTTSIDREVEIETDE